MPKAKTTVSTDGGKITVHLPFKQFINEHKNLTNILESGVQSAILEEATRQRKELDDIIKQVKGISEKEKVLDMGIPKTIKPMNDIIRENTPVATKLPVKTAKIKPEYQMKPRVPELPDYTGGPDIKKFVKKAPLEGPDLRALMKPHIPELPDLKNLKMVESKTKVKKVMTKSK